MVTKSARARKMMRRVLELLEPEVEEDEGQGEELQRAHSANAGQHPEGLSDEPIPTDAGDGLVCTTCGETSTAAFSQRMKHRRGRHGERSRRCRNCVADAERDEQQRAISRPSAPEITRKRLGKLTKNVKRRK